MRGQRTTIDLLIVDRVLSEVPICLQCQELTVLCVDVSCLVHDVRCCGGPTYPRKC
jgi:hypothetical protein